MTNFFTTLTKSTKQEREALYQVDFIQKAVKGNISKKSYIKYLTQAYHHVKHTTPLLMLVGSKISTQEEWIRNQIAEYIKEEVGHQEWILRDIKNCGGNDILAKSSMPNIATELMVSYAYDFVNRINPIGFFGMVFVLEGTSVNLASVAAKNLMKNLNLKRNCFSYLLSHGSLDVEHIKFFENIVNKITNKKDQEDVIHMAKVMFQLFANVFNSIEN